MGVRRCDSAAGVAAVQGRARAGRVRPAHRARLEGRSLSPAFAALRVDPWRLRVFPGTPSQRHGRRADLERLTPTLGFATTTPALTVAFVAKLVARGDTAAELRDLLTGALDLANGEAGTIVWFALQSDATTFWIVDAFPSQGDRQAHLKGRIAAALMANADRLLASPPEILPADVLAARCRDFAAPPAPTRPARTMPPALGPPPCTRFGSPLPPPAR